MTIISLFQVAIYLLVLIILVKPLGWYINRVYNGDACPGIGWVLKPCERLLYRFCGINPTQSMDWRGYLSAMLIFNLLGLLALYLLQRLQSHFPLNPQHLSAIPPLLAFNTAISFVTNTNWEAYDPEGTMSSLTQMLGFTVQNFTSAATGLSLLIALIRGMTRCETTDLGNFWVDTTRGILYILLPLSFILACLLVSQGVIQNFKPYQKVSLIQPLKEQPNPEQWIPMGPVASQVAIKQLGSNGGGFFNANSAHPFENPTPLTNFLEMIAILIIPASLCYTFGLMVSDKRQGWAILAAMLILFIPLLLATIFLEQRENPAVSAMVDQTFHSGLSPGGNMEGKETRFGIVSSAMWALITTASSNGSVNAMLDSFTPLGGLMPLWTMHLGEVVFGGLGSGLYGMLMFVMITVFVAGLMVGRTPEYLGKKIEAYEMKMATVAVLVMPLIVLLSTAFAVVTPMGTHSIANPSTHGFTEVLYAFTSMGNNNGSAFAGLDANTPFYNLLGGIVMLIGRYWLAIPVLAIAGSLARKKWIPSSAGTLPTHTPLFILLLVSIILLLGALSFLPALALGPIVEDLGFWRHDGY